MTPVQAKSKTFDFLIVGSGIIGLTTAYELKKRFPKARITILEKEPRPGVHASGRNSGVLHSGIYYPPDSLKARACSAGAARMREFAAEHKIPCEKWGKVIVASSEQDLPSIDRLLKNAEGNKINASRLNEKEVKEIEPHAKAHKAGIYSPDTAVIHSLSVVQKLAELLTSQGVKIIYNEIITGIDPSGKSVKTGTNVYHYGYFINSAGAYADTIARQFGLCQDYTLVPFKGIYFKLNPQKNYLVKSSIYPVPDLVLPFLGVHLTRVISGDVYIGPTAIPALGRENYQFWKGIQVKEVSGILWQMAGMYLKDQQNFRKLVHVEAKKYIKNFFLKSAQKLVPELKAEDLLPSQKVGIRPQLINKKKKKLELDFMFEKTDNSLHVLNAISPAFTSSFVFAEILVDQINKTPNIKVADLVP